MLTWMLFMLFAFQLKSQGGCLPKPKSNIKKPVTAQRSGGAAGGNAGEIPLWLSIRWEDLLFSHSPSNFHANWRWHNGLIRCYAPHHGYQIGPGVPTAGTDSGGRYCCLVFLFGFLTWVTTRVHTVCMVCSIEFWYSWLTPSDSTTIFSIFRAWLL